MKKYEKHDYKEEIMTRVREERGLGKDAIWRKIEGGSRNDFYRQLTALIEAGILRYEKKGLYLNTEDVWSRPLEHLEGSHQHLTLM